MSSNGYNLISFDSSVGRAQDWRSWGPVFDSRSKHEEQDSSLVLQQRRWCSGNINAFQAFALGSIPGRRMNDLFLLIVRQAAESDRWVGPLSRAAKSGRWVGPLSRTAESVRWVTPMILNAETNDWNIWYKLRPPDSEFGLLSQKLVWLSMTAESPVVTYQIFANWGISSVGRARA